MNFVEFLGFIIVMLAMFFILIRRAWDERKRRKNPELYKSEEEEREKALNEFLRSINVEVDETEEIIIEPPPPPKIPEPTAEDQPSRPKRLVRDAYTLQSTIEQYEKTEGIESREFETQIGESEFAVYDYDLVTEDLFLKLEPGAYDVIGNRESSRIKRLLEDLKDPRDMFIYHEIFGKPKAHQTHILPHDLAE